MVESNLDKPDSWDPQPEGGQPDGVQSEDDASDGSVAADDAEVDEVPDDPGLGAVILPAGVPARDALMPLGSGLRLADITRDCRVSPGSLSLSLCYSVKPCHPIGSCTD